MVNGLTKLCPTKDVCNTFLSVGVGGYGKSFPKPCFRTDLIVSCQKCDKATDVNRIFLSVRVGGYGIRID